MEMVTEMQDSPDGIFIKVMGTKQQIDAYMDNLPEDSQFDFANHPEDQIYELIISTRKVD